ncbi:hypothetical protein ASPSYDRAFT_306743 [Aspergillus sydowii CBS 593.65]|uniref:Uncharacterized protein n=1 Tax=Aspergillus sydowii CBS 593.65 TaxID=1036612 RepID=A0A1L9TY70_9EURO|nr:uncharacterized protein ASPSYDRAFT_306743 [Aspergillus sydowii CBS 593.65]OJJ64386.1 hypothetical protein ASPSYDRAFT_306743 [Aspergillus sydowii CBS 593.65]
MSRRLTGKRAIYNADSGFCSHPLFKEGLYSGIPVRKRKQCPRQSRLSRYFRAGMSNRKWEGRTDSKRKPLYAASVCRWVDSLASTTMPRPPAGLALSLRHPHCWFPGLVSFFCSVYLSILLERRVSSPILSLSLALPSGMALVRFSIHRRWFCWALE